MFIHRSSYHYINEIWDFDMKLYNDVVISNNAQLNLQCNFTLPLWGKYSKQWLCLNYSGTCNINNNNKITVTACGTLILKMLLH